jgi:hypothetical protein
VARYWISWHQPGTDCRPLSYPPNRWILGWWESGTTDAGSNLCALVEDRTEELAKASIRVDWPEADGNWRFCEAKSDDFVPGSRFPIEQGDWMHERVHGQAVAND